MPFQSDKQKRWMYANEPEIAREWSDRYGAMNGGIMDWVGQGGMKNYLGEQEMVNAPKHWQSAPGHETTELAYITPRERDTLVDMNMYGTMNGSPNEGPSGLMSLNGWGSSDDSQNRAGADISAGMDRSGSDAGWSSPGGGGGKYNTAMSPAQLKLAEQKNAATLGLDLSNKNQYNKFHSLGRHKFNPNKRGFSGWGGNILRGIMSIFGGAPGKIMSMLSRINPGKLRGWNEKENRYNTQKEWEDARTNRRNTKRMDYLSDRKSKGLGYGKKAYADLLGQGYSDTFQDAIERDWELEGADDNYLQNPSKNYLSSIDLSKYDPARIDTHDFEGVNFNPAHDFEGVDFNNQGITGLVNNYNPKDTGTWFDTHPATGESVMTPGMEKMYTEGMERQYPNMYNELNPVDIEDSYSYVDQSLGDVSKVNMKPYSYDASQPQEAASTDWYEWLKNR